MKELLENGALSMPIPAWLVGCLGDALSAACVGRDSFGRPSTHRARHQQAPQLPCGNRRTVRRGYVDEMNRAKEWGDELEEEEWTLFPHKDLFEICGAEEARDSPCTKRFWNPFRS